VYMCQSVPPGYGHKDADGATRKCLGSWTQNYTDKKTRDAVEAQLCQWLAKAPYHTSEEHTTMHPSIVKASEKKALAVC